MTAVRKDGGPAWLALLAGTMATCLCSLTICTGIFNIVFLEEFQRDKSTTAWLGGLQTSLFYFACEYCSPSVWNKKEANSIHQYIGQFRGAAEVSAQCFNCWCKRFSYLS